MQSCNYVRERIDESDKPDLLSFEVTEHIESCGECESFASDRASLRRLLASGPRVVAPVNFNAALNARLAEARGKRAFSWLSMPGYMRLGAATAALVLMAFAAQYAGLFSNEPNQKIESRAGATVPIPSAQAPMLVTPSPAQPESPDISNIVAQRNFRGASRTAKTSRGVIAVNGSGVPVGYPISDDGGVVLLRGQNGNGDVPMPTVSVGAQPLLYVSAGQRQVRSVSASF